MLIHHLNVPNDNGEQIKMFADLQIVHVNTSTAGPNANTLFLCKLQLYKKAKEYFFHIKLSHVYL